MRKNTKNSLYNEINPYIIPYKWSLSIILITNLISSLIVLTIPYFIMNISEIIESSTPSTRELNNLLLILAIIFVIQAILGFVSHFFTQKTGEELSIKLRERAFKHFLNLPMFFYHEYTAGELTTRLTDDINAMKRVVTEHFVNVVKNLLMVVLIIIILITINPLLTLAIFGAVLLIGIGSNIALNKIKQISSDIQDRHSQLMSFVNESFMNIPIIKGFVREDYVSNKFNEKSVKYLRMVLRRTKIISMIRPLSNLISYCLIGISFWFAIHQVLIGNLLASELLGYIGFAFILAASITTLTTHLGSLKKESGTVNKLLEFLNLSVESDLINNVSTFMNGDIEFNNVSFSYRKNELTILNNMNFRLKVGTKNAIVGSSGMGKSTIVNLLLKYFSPEEGQILIGGKDIHDVRINDLRENIGIVLQNTYLFNTTIFENILIGNPKATREEVMAAAKAANVDQFVINFPSKYDTVVGEMGNKLSRGQAQRIAIARMLLKDPKIIILDEATASLDNENEKLVHEAINKIMEKRTTLIISHKLNSLTKLDKILYLSNGKIIEEGSHHELISQQGEYYEMYNAPH
jgi:ABC-type multidrug transport system fused ATPase/permease subunit